MSQPLDPEKPLTATQQRVLDAIVAFHAEAGRLPSRIVLAQRLNVKPNGNLGRIVDKLRAKRLLPATRARATDFRLIDRSGPAVITVLAIGGGYAMVRRPGYSPFVISEDDWDIAPRCDKEGNRL